MPAPAEYLGSKRLEQKLPFFGGLSGLEFTADGQRFTVLSDSAVLFSGTVSRDERGMVTSVMLDGPGHPLTGPDGKNLTDPLDDSEGLALAPDGGLYISFELRNRVARYFPDGRWLADLPRPRDFLGLGNSGLEGLAAAPDGTLYTMPEGPSQGTLAFPVYRYRAGTWSEAFTLPEDHRWRLVGADFGMDGRLYILERDYWPLIGFRSRLRRISLEGDRVISDRVLFETRPGQFDNLEGLSIWQDGDGQPHATMVSDNNFLFTQISQFVDYRIDDRLDPPAPHD
ncbi:MAG: esterase-like activity of phytase family protein [Rhodobacteraceae bacterium]|nr:esterase-like activity of phytase family protein [Paracoccaceae bacterium]